MQEWTTMLLIQLEIEINDLSQKIFLKISLKQMKGLNVLKIQTTQHQACFKIEM